MATVAIDFGLRYTKWAVCDLRTRAIELGGCVPSLTHVSRSGAISAGEPGKAASVADPAGAIDDLKLRLESEVIIRNRCRIRPVDLTCALFQEVHKGALSRLKDRDRLDECCVAVPHQFNVLQVEVLSAAAREAGFTKLELLDEPSAAARHHDRQSTIEEDTVVVCDLGGQSRLSVLRRREEGLRLDAELSVSREWPNAKERLPPLMLDAVQRLAVRLAADDASLPLLLVVGGELDLPGLEPAFRDAGWTGRIVIGDPHAAVLGAVEVPMVPQDVLCPECNFPSISKASETCPECGFPLRVSSLCPECASPCTPSAKDCQTCGFPLQIWRQLNQSPFDSRSHG